MFDECYFDSEKGNISHGLASLSKVSHLMVGGEPREGKYTQYNGYRSVFPCQHSRAVYRRVKLAHFECQDSEMQVSR